ncbi:aldolase [Ceraceosorus guamensis]|uniref:hydroxymethylglutaryl-CoA lyase n=1 Tax=Ceraceosorus guamensis TaxID=1522189 RepID=A0A316VUE2_9BASI|nr:aldolase [Ceraceosorus guamensis]PWN40508.1 aldolase [Ceraceosorus guamensis]
MARPRADAYSLLPCATSRALASIALSPGLGKDSPHHVRIVEVSPRDGLQNEKQVVPLTTKLELIRRLVEEAGVETVEAGSFVSPKWVPQMADSAAVLEQMTVKQGVSYPFLVPNDRGLVNFLDMVGPKGRAAGRSDEIAIFTAATDAFTKANTNCTIHESLERLSKVTSKALGHGIRVRGYISVVADCPYSGKVNPADVGKIAKTLLEMGCYEISLGDTTGAGTPGQMLNVLNECTRHAPSVRFAAHCHDTFGSAVANVLAMVNAGVRVVDAAVGGLGGCPYSPGASGNVDVESVVYALHESGYDTGLDLDALAQIGAWISQQLDRPNGSSAGRAILARAKVKSQSAKQSKL